MKVQRHVLFLRLAALALLAGVHQAAAQGTAFTYQGQLSVGGSPANGNYDFTFALYNDPQSGGQIGSAETNSAVTVANGLFTTTLDFASAPWTGQSLWLQILVRTNGSSAFSPLTPRQPLTSVPYAIQSLRATTANTTNFVLGSNISGTLPNSALPSSPVFSGTITANSFSGNGSGLSNVPVGVSVKAFGAYGDGLHDDYRTIQTAINTLVSNFNGGTLYFPPGEYFITEPLIIPPVPPQCPVFPTIRLMGASAPGPYNGTTSLTSPNIGGTVLVAINPSSGESVLSCQNPVDPYARFTNTYPIKTFNLNAINVDIENIAFRVTYANCAMLDLSGASSAVVKNCVIATGVDWNSGAFSQNPGSCGLICPVHLNAGNDIVENVVVVGFNNGYVLGEHIDLIDCHAYSCYNAVAVLYAGGYPCRLNHLDAEYCMNVIYSPPVGGGSSAQNLLLQFEDSQLQMEGDNTIINDQLNNLSGHFVVITNYGGQWVTNKALYYNGINLVGGATLCDMTYLSNVLPPWRDRYDGQNGFFSGQLAGNMVYSGTTTTGGGFTGLDAYLPGGITNGFGEHILYSADTTSYDNGGNLTNLRASQLTGTIPASALPANVLAALPALDQKLQEEEAQAKEKEAEIGELRQSMAELKQLVQALAAKK